jgi:hypothetical protein
MTMKNVASKSNLALDGGGQATPSITKLLTGSNQGVNSSGTAYNYKESDQIGFSGLLGSNNQFRT